MGPEKISGDLQGRNRLLAPDRWEMIEEALEWIASGQIVEKVLDRYAGANEYGGTAHDLRIDCHDGFQ